ncbi:MAG: S9 family peptidase [Proteobacteria bacterium]|nr:S9 family peptidase [Pseudomonadota bacterium]
MGDRAVRVVREFIGNLLILLALATTLLASAAPLRAEDIPPRLPAADFARLPMYQDAQLSPDGKYFAYIMPIEGRNNVVVQRARMKDGKPARIPPIKKFDIDWIRWANNERLLIAYSAIATGFGGTRAETRLVVVDAEVTEIINMVKPKRQKLGGGKFYGQIETDVIDMLPDDPEHILMALDPTRDGSYAVMKINIYTQRQTRVQSAKRDVQDWMTDQQGVPRLGYGYWGKSSKINLHYRDPETRKWIGLQNTNWFEAHFWPRAFMEDPRFAYAIGPVDGRDALVRLNVPEGKIEEKLFAHEKVDVRGLEFGPGLRKVVGVRYTEHFSRVHYFDAYLKKIQTAIDRLLPDTANDIAQALPGGKLFLIRARNGHIPAEYHVLDIAGKQLYFLVSTRPQLHSDQMAHVEPVTYEARDGLEIPSYITWPKGRARKNLPAIILPHGGPHSRDTMDFDYLAQFLANRGYLVFQPNFRGSTGYGAAFEKAGRRQWGGVMQDDLTDGTNWLVSEGLADPARICIVGWSYGGYAALMGAVKTPDLFQCAASINGVANLPALVQFDRGFIGGSSWIKSITLDEEGRRAASPHHRADEIKIPIFLATAKDDIRVPYRQSKSFYRKIREQVPATYVEIKTGGHSLEHEDGRRKMLEALDAFLAEFLPVEG